MEFKKHVKEAKQIHKMTLWRDMKPRMFGNSCIYSSSFPQFSSPTPSFLLQRCRLSCLILHSANGSHGWKLLQIPSTKSTKLNPCSPPTLFGHKEVFPSSHSGPVLRAAQHSTTLPGTSVHCYFLDLPPALRSLQLDGRYSLCLPC